MVQVVRKAISFRCSLAHHIPRSVNIVELGIAFACRMFDYCKSWLSGVGTKSRRLRLIMLSWALTFLVLALIAVLFGFAGIAASATSIAKILFFLFIALFVVSLVANMVRGRNVGCKTI